MASDKDISGRTIGREDIALIFEGVPGEPGTKVPLRNRPSSTNKMEHQSGDTIQTENMKVDEDVQENVFLEYLCISEDGQGSSDPSVNLDEKGKIPAEKLAPEQADLNESRVVSISAPQTATSCNRKPVPDADPVAIAPNWNPIVLQHKDNQVETTNTKLTMFDKEVPVMNAKSQLPKFYHASMTGDQSSSSTISCIVGPRLPIEVMEHSFKFMVSCRHPNILKPFGVWNFDDGTGLITFPVLDGTISKIPRSELFVEHGGILSDFTEEGHRVMRDISCAVHYVNMHYGREEACTGPGGPRW
uniref:Protein kinase domain-containing protein n=1 Tax=Arundo donax TaxID=35708 RepID=A0A0A8YEX0_ARUDO